MSKYEELSKLKELLDAGVLSKEEFETKKKDLVWSWQYDTKEIKEIFGCYNYRNHGYFGYWWLFLLWR